MTLPEVASYLSGSNVLVTGVTGFVGLALVEKLIRTVPNIGSIYVLIRPKRGKSMEDRLNEIKQSSIFEVLVKNGRGSALDKLVALEGNIDADNLGMSQQDQQIVISNVNYVFHCAATLDFEASLKTTVEINLLGTRRVVELCKKIQHLKALLHVSSAYTNANRKSAEEILYPAPEDVNKVVNLVQTLSDSQIEESTQSLLKNHPNTYTFTKALAEHEVANSFRDIPSCIVRPSMIVGVMKDPMPGWTNSKNGPQGFIMGAAMGVVRRLPVAKSLVYDYIPVDKVVNTMILGAIYVASKRDQLTETPIFHCTTSTCNPFKWEMVEHGITDLLQKNPLMQAVWYPHLKLLPSVWHYRMSSPIFHMIPAYFFDTLARVTGGRPKLVRLHTSINQSLERLEPFIFQEWFFDNTKQMQLHQEISPADKELFGLDVSSLKWERFFEDMSMGVRLYLHKEKESALPRAIKKNKVLMVLNLTVQITLFALIWLIFKSLGLPGLQAALVLPVVYLLYSML